MAASSRVRVHLKYGHWFLALLGARVPGIAVSQSEADKQDRGLRGLVKGWRGEESALEIPRTRTQAEAGDPAALAAYLNPKPGLTPGFLGLPPGFPGFPRKNPKPGLTPGFRVPQGSTRVPENGLIPGFPRNPV